MSETNRASEVRSYKQSLEDAQEALTKANHWFVQWNEVASTTNSKGIDEVHAMMDEVQQVVETTLCNLIVNNHERKELGIDKIDLDSFYVWAKEQQLNKTMISMKVEIDQLYSEEPRVWVYNYDLVAGRNVNKVEEIDFDAWRKVERRRQYEELKAEFEGIRNEETIPTAEENTSIDEAISGIVDIFFKTR